MQSDIDTTRDELLEALDDILVLAEVDGFNARLLRGKVKSGWNVVNSDDPLGSEQLCPLHSTLSNRSETLLSTKHEINPASETTAPTYPYSHDIPFLHAGVDHVVVTCTNNIR